MKPIVCLLAAIVTPVLLAATDPLLIGFKPERAAEQIRLEEKFDGHLRKDDLPEWMKWMSSRPHHLGSSAGREVAEFIASRFQEWGYKAKIERFDVLFPTPKTRVLELLGANRFTAALTEPVLSEDSTSGVTAEQLPPYNAFSIDGNVTAEVVYVNYGVPKDYEVLAEKGIAVRGKIVIARYGGSWRGIKPKVAAEHGAVGCLIYSDPAQDGYFQGDAYPKGPWRSEQGAQRGSVSDMPLYPGDPLTPGIGATPDARRLPLSEAQTITKIPVLPLSYADALPILRDLRGPGVPESWRGGLPLTYHFGPTASQVHLQLQFEWKQVPCFDVIAILEGAERPDEWVIRGNHHDAWVFGANDPLSGTVAMMEEARGISELVKSGWRPKRTIVFAAWDGEEPGLIGSTEWVETHADLLRKRAVVYINGDTNGRGFLRVGGSHSLESIVNEVAEVVADPETKVSVAERFRAMKIAAGSADERRELRERKFFHISPLGSGSDYTPFLQHLGIATMDIRFDDGQWHGVYHSIYDSFDHYTRFVDPGFAYGIALAKTGGRMVLRFANADVLPIRFASFSEMASKYAKEVVKLADDLREEIKESNLQLQEKAGALIADPRQPYFPPQRLRPPPHFNFAPLQNAVARVQESSKKCDAALKQASESLTGESARALDLLVLRSEQALTDPKGLPRRPWFKHMIYAPGFYTGYGVKTLPAIREAIEEQSWDDVDEQVALVSRALTRFGDALEAIAAHVEKHLGK